MLSVLKITNLALVESLTWELGEGLVCVTGETGAGKSIIVGAIKLVLGDRADRSLVRAGADTCTVEAAFELGDAALVNEQLAAFGLDPCEDGHLVVKRVIGAKSGSRQFINCSPATLAALKALGHFLVDLHGPHEHQSLISQDRQLNMLDAFARAENSRRQYHEAYQEWRGLDENLRDLSNSERATEQEIDLLKYQIEDIAAADPKPEEVGSLEGRHRVASNAAHLLEVSQQILHQLAESDTAVLNQLGESQRLIRHLQSTDPQTAEFTREFDSALIHLEEMVLCLQKYVAALEIDPSEIARIEERINLLETLKRKYGHSIEEVIAFRERAEVKLARIQGRGHALTELERDLKAARADLDELAAKLSQRRHTAAPRLARRIGEHLGDLGLRGSKIDIDFQPCATLGAQGAESVDFIFAPNPGEPAKPLRLIASSGEMARVMLAVKSALAKEDAIPLLVFDEIDVNVGGEIASSVGAKMAELAKDHQVVSITHLPQVAALADCHCVVEKEFADRRTRSLLQTITGQDRIEELARMLGGDLKSARTHAKSLLAR